MNSRISKGTSDDILDEVPVSFVSDIAPLFTTKDSNCMKIRQNDRGQNIVLTDYATWGMRQEMPRTLIMQTPVMPTPA